MSGTGGLEDFLILLLVALIPALIYLSWIRGTERYRTLAWGPVLGAFAYGALFATFVAAILELIVVAAGTAVSQRYPAPEFVFLNGNSTAGAFFLVLVVAPLIEEALKASGVLRYSPRIQVVADGPVFGASVGLGFGFLETLLYGLGAYVTAGLAAGILLIAIRGVSSVLLHASSTATFGYGYSIAKIRGRTGASGAYYLVAVAMHATFNALASLGAIFAIEGVTSGFQDLGSVIGLFAAILFAWAATQHIRSLIQQNEFPSAFAQGKLRSATVPPRGASPPGRSR